jgi:hypothetical protein
MSRAYSPARRLVAARLEDADADSLARNEPLLAWLAQASIRTRIATGSQAGERWRRVGDRVEPGMEETGSPSRDQALARHHEMSLHAAVAVPAGDRRRLERLCRYVARPPIASDRLRELPDGRLSLRLKTRWRDGTTHILMEPRDLIDRLVPLIPPPRAHQVRYHGILAPGASLRSRVVPGGAVATSNTETTEPNDPLGARLRRLRWAVLLQRVFAVDALHCPRCGGTLRLLAAIEDPSVARSILECIGLPVRAPPSAEAPSEPEFDSHFQPVPDFDFGI